jgi:hypothetical protein
MTMQIGATAGAGYSFDPQLTVQGGDIGAEVAGLAVQCGLRSETADDQIEQAEEQAAATESNAQVQAMRRKADDVRAAGIVEGCIGMAAGALQGGTAASDAAAANSATSAAASALKAQGEWFRAASTGLEGGGKIVDAFAQGSQLSDDATAKADGDAADRALQAARDEHDAASGDQSLVQSALQAASQTEQAEASTRLALAQRV